MGLHREWEALAVYCNQGAMHWVSNDLGLILALSVAWQGFFNSWPKCCQYYKMTRFAKRLSLIPPSDSTLCFWNLCETVAQSISLDLLINCGHWCCTSPLRSLSLSVMLLVYRHFRTLTHKEGRDARECLLFARLSSPCPQPNHHVWCIHLLQLNTKGGEKANESTNILCLNNVFPKCH